MWLGKKDAAFLGSVLIVIGLIIGAYLGWLFFIQTYSCPPCPLKITSTIASPTPTSTMIAATPTLTPTAMQTATPEPEFWDVGVPGILGVEPDPTQILEMHKMQVQNYAYLICQNWQVEYEIGEGHIYRVVAPPEWETTLWVIHNIEGDAVMLASSPSAYDCPTEPEWVEAELGTAYVFAQWPEQSIRVYITPEGIGTACLKEESTVVEAKDDELLWPEEFPEWEEPFILYPGRETIFCNGEWENFAMESIMGGEAAGISYSLWPMGPGPNLVIVQPDVSVDEYNISAMTDEGIESEVAKIGSSFALRVEGKSPLYFRIAEDSLEIVCPQ